MQLSKILRTNVNYYKRFGLKGLKLLFDRATKSNQIMFKHSEFKYPVFLRNKTSDMPTFEQILIFCDYNIDFGFVPEVIFDLGANIGLATVFFKNKYPDASIICVEPEISNFYLLKKNVERYSNIHFYNNGIWNKKTNLVIEDTNRGNWGFTVRETVTNNVNSISAITIDEIMNQLNINSIDVLKIDIEGSEKELFELNYQTWLPKVKVILIELHDYIREGAAKSFFSALVHNDFSMTHRGENIICFMR